MAALRPLFEWGWLPEFNDVALKNQCHLELVLEKLRHGLIKNGYLCKICLASWSVLLSVDFFPPAISLSLLLQRVKNRTMKPVA